MPETKVVFFKEDDGTVPVFDWLDGGNLIMSQKREPTTDAVEILHRRYFEGKPEMMELLEEERANAEIARQIYDLRTEAGLTQQELAKLVGTSPSVIDSLEEADYEGNALAMLRRVAAALDKRVEIRFVPAKSVAD